MSLNQFLLLIFIICGGCFFYGSLLGYNRFILLANLFMVPSIGFYYFRKTKVNHLPLNGVFFLFFLRDFFLMLGFVEFAFFNYGCFFLAIGILIFYALTEFRMSRIYIAEWFSFAIIYGFSIFLFYSLSEMVPVVLPGLEWPTYFYLLLLVIFLSISFSVYFLKSHKASLWLMLCASSITFSESCLFLKLFVVDDVSVAIFYPLFHVFTYFSLAMFGLNRRKKNILKVF